MGILIAFLTFILVMVSLFLILLVLVQLPKKDAGVGMAFGAGMSEMLLGAGSGNVLTRITKYTVGIFLGLSLVLSILVSGQARKSGMGVIRAIEEQARTAPQRATTPQVPSGPTFQPLSIDPNVSVEVGPADSAVASPVQPEGSTTQPLDAAEGAPAGAPGDVTQPSPLPSPAPVDPPQETPEGQGAPSETPGN